MDRWLNWIIDSHAWLYLLAIVLIAGFFWLIRPRVGYGWKPLLTERERTCFWRLHGLVADQGWVLLSQVAFSQFLLVIGEGKARNREWYRWRQKVADFVICDEEFNIIAVIELDDSSHIGKEEQDAERDRILNEAGIATLRFPDIPTERELALAVQALARDS